MVCGHTLSIIINPWILGLYSTGFIKMSTSLFGANLDSEGLLRHYIPMLGVANYNLLALTVLNPKLVRNLNARDEPK